MKRFALISSAALTCVALAAPVATSAKELVMSGVSATSDDYQLAVIWSNILVKGGGPTRITPVENGTVAGMRKAARGQVDIVGVGSPHYRDAVEGKGSYKDDPPNFRDGYKEMRALFAIPTGMAQYVARADGSIKSIGDFKGKKVGIGRPGGNAGMVSERLFKVHGLDIKSGDVNVQYIEYGPALEQMASGTLDATLVWGSVPNAAIDNASRGMKLRFISPDPSTLPEFRKALTNGDYYVYQKVPAPTISKAYEGRVVSDGPAYFWTFPWQIMARKDLPDDVAYAITKAFWTNLAEVHKQSAALSLISLDYALDALSAELHPGAARYYKEIGRLK